MRGLFWVACFCFAMFLPMACSREKDEVIPEDEMVDILADLQMAQAYASTHPAGSGSQDIYALRESILEKHGVSQEQLDSTIAFYGKNMDKYYELYGKVGERLKTMNGQVEFETNEDDIWPFEHFTVFTPRQISNDIVFSIPADELAPGDALNWKLRLSRAADVDMMLGIEYDNGISSLVRKNFSGNVNPSMNILSDTALRVSRIFGTFSAPESAMPLWADSISLVKTPFDSLEYFRLRQQKTIFPPAPKPKPQKEDPDSLSEIPVSQGK